MKISPIMSVQSQKELGSATRPSFGNNKSEHQSDDGNRAHIDE